MADLADKYKIPPEVMAFVNDGFLVLLAEVEAEKTIEFHIPSKRQTDDEGRITSYSVIWIHPDFNAEFCHYYDEKPGDLPNFYVRIDTDCSRGEQVDDLETVEDLVDWLSESKKATSSANLDAFPLLLAACQAVVERWEHGDLAEAARMCSEAVDMAFAKQGDEADGPTQAIDALLAKAETAGLKAEDLDESVHELAASIAADVNNEGMDGQIRYLVEQMGVQAATKELDRLAEKQTATTDEGELGNE